MLPQIAINAYRKSKYSSKIFNFLQNFSAVEATPTFGPLAPRGEDNNYWHQSTKRKKTRRPQFFASNRNAHTKNSKIKKNFLRLRRKKHHFFSIFFYFQFLQKNLAVEVLKSGWVGTSTARWKSRNTDTLLSFIIYLN